MDNNRCYFTLSGFGPFGSVKLNPTMELISSITEEEKQRYNITLCQVVEVSTVGCHDHIQQVCQLQSELEGKSVRIINLHFGVYAGSSQIQLEQCGYNTKDFSIPDVRGYIATGEKICDHLEEDQPINTLLNLDLLESRLKEGGFTDLKQSDDPGRYICNYIYFHSLNELSKCKNSSSLFVHVPLFNKINKELQRSFVINLIETLTTMNQQNELLL